jgi:hypothetical protein
MMLPTTCQQTHTAQHCTPQHTAHASAPLLEHHVTTCAAAVPLPLLLLRLQTITNNRLHKPASWFARCTVLLIQNVALHAAAALLCCQYFARM